MENLAGFKQHGFRLQKLGNRLRMMMMVLLCSNFGFLTITIFMKEIFKKSLNRNFIIASVKNPLKEYLVYETLKLPR